MKNRTLLTLTAVLLTCGLSHAYHNAKTCPSGMRKMAGSVPLMEETIMNGKTIVDIAVADPSFSTLVTALKAADLVATLAGTDEFTVFAPTNEAFAKIPKADLDALLADKAKLAKVLTYHVVPGKVTASEVVKLPDAHTVEGSKVTFRVEDGKVYVNNAEVVKADVDAKNGVIHVIDTVLLPE